MIRILVLCTGNAARSQISEGLLRRLGGSHVEIHSAGTHPAGFVHPLAIETMKERGIDVSHQESKSVNRFLDQEFDYVITVCDDAQLECPFFPGAKRQLHWGTPDPSMIVGDEEIRRKAFRETIRSLETRIKEFLDEIKNNKARSI